MLSTSPLTGIFQKGNAALQSLGSQITDLASKATGKKTDAKTVSDQLVLSHLSRQLDLLDTEAGLGSGGEGEGMALDGLAGLESLKQRGMMMANVLQMKLNSFEQKMISSMKAAGIDTSQGVTLQDGDDLGLLLSGEHPDLGKIQKMFQEDETLMRQFQEIANLATLVHGIRQLNVEAGTGSTHSPIAAYQQQQGAASETGNRFTMQIAATGTSFGFE